MRLFCSISMSIAMKNVKCVTRKLKFMESLHLKCLFYYFKTCGLAPLNFNLQAINSAKVYRWTFSCSWKNTVCNLILVVCISIWSYSTMSDIYYTKKRLGFDDSVYAIVDTYGIVSTICIILIFNLQQTRLSSLFNKINNTREIIKIVENSNTQHKTLFNKIMILMCINVLAWLFLLSTILMYDIEIMLSFLAPTICTYVRNAFILQYCISLKIIEDLFNVLNENLSDLSKYFCSSLEDPSNNTIVIDSELSRLWEWYSLLSKLTQDVADFYSLPMLFIIICEFLMSIVITYYLSKPIIFGYSELDNLDYANSFAFFFIHVYPVILLATSASGAISKVRNFEYNLF